MVRSIRPNDMVSKTVITVSAETVDLHEGRWLFCRCAIKAWICKKGRHSDTSFHFIDIKNHKDTNFAIGGFLAGLHRSPLTLLFIFQDSLATLWLITSKTVQPTDKWSIISWRRLWEVSKNFENFIFLEFFNSFHRQRAEMVWTRSRVTSPGPQESREASNNPRRDCHLTPTMQPSSVQHVQSMAAAMAELTRQNQELTRELNSRRQHRDGNTEGHT